ncbi:hypothetical protein FSP39_013040 [Pinctada imbricata]|uniref:UDP-N-acetylglucosamine transferase subunit ALG13 n=1 Tax=Pinctada imbricata TaxID=66713 RepID=A0AA88Y0C9_PINIB|nr:hypothetical protein FSP39_013040 [Pinctada imbricata]
MTSSPVAFKSVFVTVGTTQFDKLITKISEKKVLHELKKKGCEKLILQIGRGEIEPPSDSQVPGLEIEYFRFKPDISGDINSADLVISHAGAGSCLETLGAGKCMLVVINDDLMNNHQTELAHQLYKDGHLTYCTCSSLEETLQTLDFSNIEPFPPAETAKFAEFLDRVVGFS